MHARFARKATDLLRQSASVAVTALALSPIAHGGCSQQATIRTRDGSSHVGKILRNDGRHIVFDDGKGRIMRSRAPRSKTSTTQERRQSLPAQH
jgi:hypothetical protein